MFHMYFFIIIFINFILIPGLSIKHASLDEIIFNVQNVKYFLDWKICWKRKHLYIL